MKIWYRGGVAVDLRITLAGNVLLLGIDEALDKPERFAGNRILDIHGPGPQKPGETHAGDAGRFIGTPASLGVLARFQKRGRLLDGRIPNFRIAGGQRQNGRECQQRGEQPGFHRQSPGIR